MIIKMSTYPVVGWYLAVELVLLVGTSQRRTITFFFDFFWIFKLQQVLEVKVVDPSVLNHIFALNVNIE